MVFKMIEKLKMLIRQQCERFILDWKEYIWSLIMINNNNNTNKNANPPAD